MTPDSPPPPAPADTTVAGDAPPFLYGTPAQRDYYQERLNNNLRASQEAEARFNRIAITRLGVVLGGIALAIGAWAIAALAALGVLVATAALFYWLTRVHDTVDRHRRATTALAEVNARELRRLRGDFANLPDGAEFADPQHPYLDDLDLFGNRSLFVRLNRAGTSLGRKRLANWLVHGADADEICSRQAAISELAKDPELLQRLQAQTLDLDDSDQDPERLSQWLAANAIDDAKPPPRPILYLASAIIFVAVAAAFAGKVSTFVVALLAIGGWIWTLNAGRVIGEVLKETRGLASLLDRYAGAIALLESTSFTAPWLRDRHAQLSGTAAASQAIPQLKAALDQMEVRNNPVLHFPLDLLGFWDCHALHRLQTWRQRYAASAPAWLDVVADFEAIASLAATAANNPDWCVPEIAAADSNEVIAATQLGHPLIPDDGRVNNDLQLRAGQVLLITGSNMAGKSTFMRSVGVGIVLAQTGSRVCARQFRWRHAVPWTSMRTRDSLVDSESTFYAELRRLKQVIETVESAPATQLFILDEVLRGTNSRDRHLGSEALLRQLVEAGGTGLIATHDLELASLADDHPAKVQLVCFESTLEDGKLFFDYTLRTGVCENLNASYLMNNMGIKIKQ